MPHFVFELAFPKGNPFMRSIRMFILFGVMGVVVGISLMVGGWYVRRGRQQRFLALFEGPVQVVGAGPLSYCATYAYDTESYESYASTYEVPDLVFPTEGSKSLVLDWMEEEAREKLEALMRQRTDGITGATTVARLRSPTVYRERMPSEALRITYPPEGAVFPVNLCPPGVEWEDPLNDVWLVEVGVEGGSCAWRFVVEERRWWFSGEVWDWIREEGVDKAAWVRVKGVLRGKPERGVQASQRIRFRISQWPADDFLVYRLVPPPFNSRKTPDTFVRDLRSFETRFFVRARRKYCINCHTFSSKRGDEGVVGIQTRYMAGGDYALKGMYDLSAQRGWKVRLPFSIQMSTYMAWSPNGDRLAFSANQQLVTLAPIVHETQFAGEPTSDIAVYEPSRNVAYLVPGASDPEVLEMYPRWTPGGDTLVFAATPAGSHPALTRYELFVVPFDGGKGGTSRAIPGASGNGRSNYYPRFSPDGRWFSFCQSDGGCLIKSSSDLYLMRGDLKGVARRLACNVPYAADSWHSWSSNGHWLVFASKRDDGIYARLYLTCIDEEGEASPAVRVPLKEVPLESFNIPEFVENDPRVSERALYEAIRVEGPAVEVQGRQAETEAAH
jgi:hypothetical protein